LGVISEAEYLDFECLEYVEAREALGRINDSLPGDVRFTALEAIGGRVPGLGESIHAARYRIETRSGIDLGEALARFRSKPSVPVIRERKGKVRTFDLAQELSGLEQLGCHSARFVLAVQAGGASVRPEEASWAILGDQAGSCLLIREELLVDWEGRAINPLLAAAAFRAGQAAV
jgi:radical SAM-linked protein